MPGDLELWRTADDALGHGVPACLIVMVGARGTVPNRPGAKLLVTGDGRRVGTVGGGPSEHALSERAAGMLHSEARGQSEVIEMEHTEDGSGMLCSGTQTFAVLRLEPEDSEAVSEIIDALERGVEGTLRIDTNGIDFVPGPSSASGPRWSEDENGWRYEEETGPPDVVTIIGGGHVSLALSRVLAPLGFRVVVLDNRPGLDTMATNGYASEKRVIEYERVAEHVPEGDRSYVCIMTFGHEHDEAVLSGLIHHPLRYLGMMGSPSKVSGIFAHLIEAGLEPALLRRVRAPIGVPIGSDTPGEIAVSVAAELIAERGGAPLVWRDGSDREAS